MGTNLPINVFNNTLIASYGVTQHQTDMNDSVKRGQKNRLTPVQVEQAYCPKGATEARLYDGEGMSLVVYESGLKVFRTRIKGLNEKETLITLGTTEQLTLEQAREINRTLREARKQGKEPKHVFKALFKMPTETTVARLVEEYLEQKKDTWKYSTYQTEVKRAVKHIYDSSLGKISINELTLMHLYEWAISMDKKDYKVQHKKVLDLVKRSFYYGQIAYGINPIETECIYHFLKKHKTKSHASVELDDIPVINKAIINSSCSLQVKILWEFLILTLLRVSEALNCTWDNVNFKEQTLTIPGASTKNGLENIIPLSPQALEALELAKILSGDSRYIFPSPHKNSDKPMSKNTIGKLLRELGFKNIMTAHGTRSTFSTEMHEKLEPSDSVVIEMVLSHVDKDSVRQVYNRKSFVKKRRDILNQWGAMYAEITRDCSCTAFVKNELQKHNLL